MVASIPALDVGGAALKPVAPACRDEIAAAVRETTLDGVVDVVDDGGEVAALAAPTATPGDGRRLACANMRSISWADICCLVLTTSSGCNNKVETHPEVAPARKLTKDAGIARDGSFEPTRSR